MIDLNRNSTIKKNELIDKSVKKRSMYSLIDDASFIYLSSYCYHPRLMNQIPTGHSDRRRQNYRIMRAKNKKIEKSILENEKINHIYRESMIGLKNQFLKTD